jgi:uncharacterized phiE125 gp8 family phage protein
MATSLQVTSQPMVEPAAIDLVRQHCRIDHGSDDALLAGYLSAARIMAERYLSRALITQTLRFTMMPEPPLRPAWHYFRNPLVLPRAPVQSIVSVTILDADGNGTMVPATAVPITPPPFMGFIADLDLVPARVRIGRDTVLSDKRTLYHAGLGHVQVDFVAGYGDTADAIPQTIIQAVLMTTAHLYENRGDVGGDLPAAAQWLLDPDRLMWM